MTKNSSEPGQTLNCDGNAAYPPEQTFAHAVGDSFAAAIGYDAEGKVRTPSGLTSGGRLNPGHISIPVT